MDCLHGHARTYTLFATARIATSTTQQPQWLPVGTRVPPGQAISAPPEPYDPAKHGPALPAPTDEVNLAARPDFVPPPKRVPTGPNPPPPGSGDRGIGWSQITKPWYGAYSVYDVQCNLYIDTVFAGEPGAFIYAPTTLAAGGTCIEITQVYERLRGVAATKKVFGLYDWCQSDPNQRWALLEDEEDSVFKTRYVRSYQGRDTYSVAVVTPNTGHTSGQCWYAHIYNYEVGGWVQRLVSCGTSYSGTGNAGWTIWESWFTANDNVCRTYPSIRALDIALADPDSAKFLPFTNYPQDHWNHAPNGMYCWSGPDIWGTIYTFEFPVPGLAANTWRGDTPNP